MISGEKSAIKSVKGGKRTVHPRRSWMSRERNKEKWLYTGILDQGMLLASSMNKRTVVYCLLADLSEPMFNRMKNHDPGMRSRLKNTKRWFQNCIDLVYFILKHS